MPDFLVADAGRFTRISPYRIGYHDVVSLFNEASSAKSLWEEFPPLPLATIDKVIAFHLENQTAKGSVTLLPTGDCALVEIDQLSESCLNPDHPRGRHPAQVFAAAVGLTVDHATELPSALVAAARSV